MLEAEDEPLFADRAAGIDIAKAGIEVTIRVPSDTRRGGRQQETRSFRTTRKDLLALADWLRRWQVTKVGMESTGDYWKPVYFLLQLFRCIVLGRILCLAPTPAQQPRDCQPVRTTRLGAKGNESAF